MLNVIQLPRTFVVFLLVSMVTFGIYLVTSPGSIMLIKSQLTPGIWKSSMWKQNLIEEASSAQNPGSGMATKPFLTIGIASVYRPQQYLKRTLESLVNQSWAEERELATIVLFLADIDEDQRLLQYNLVQDNFRAHLESGFLQIITASSAIYPSFDFALHRRTYDDSVDRVIWRTKQVIDFAFLFTYVKLHHLSDYYMVAEDDIVASNQYITAIRDFVTLKTSDGSTWSALQFTNFVGIGLLFNSGQLERLTDFLLVFHKEHPVDVLMRTFTRLENPGLTNDAVINRVPSTFQHIGKQSTLPHKTQNWVDDSFGQGKRKYGHKNPPTQRITTTLTTDADFVPENAYSPAPGWFRGSSNSKGLTDTGYYDIIYSHPISVLRIVVISGNYKREEKILRGKLLLGATIFGGTREFCRDLNFVKDFDSTGVIDIGFNNSIQVQCVRLEIPSVQGSICVREIKVFGS